MRGFHWWMVPAGVAVYLTLYLTLAWFVPAVLKAGWAFVLHLTHRFHALGRDRVPRTGAVLVVSNHVSYLDWMFHWVACPRPVTFVLWAGYRKKPVLRFWLSFVRHRAVFIENRSRAPHVLAAALDRVAAALDDGRCVLVFPEGRLTRNGQMMPFRRGIERVLRRAKVPVTVVPACVWNVWGSLLTHKWGRMYWRWPEVFRRRVAVYYGRPLVGPRKAADVRAAVVECLAECAAIQCKYELPVHAGFVRNGARLCNLFRIGFTDAATGTDRRLTWSKTLVAAWALAAWLKKRLATDERYVGVWLPTGLGSALSNMALAFLRRTSVNLNYSAGDEAVASAAKQTGLRTVVTARAFVRKVPLNLPPDVTLLYLEDALTAAPKWANALRFAAVVVLPGWFLDRVVLQCRRFKWDDPLTVIFSSGSTGDPKGVVLSLRNVTANADGFQKGVNFGTDDVMLCTLPFFHSFGYTVCLWAPACIGMASVYHPDPRSAKEIGELCRRRACTIALATATFLRFYLRRCDPADFQTVRLLICGAEKLPVPLQEEFAAKFGVRPLEGYGCTELSPVVSTNLPDVTVRGITQEANIPGTIGQPIPGVAVKAFDPDTKQPLPLGAEGVLGVKGPNVMVGYWQRPDKTAEVMAGDWYLTGDRGRVEANGFVRITGRLSRFAKIGGEMVPLERLDEELHAALGMTGERAVAVGAVPDAKRGERLVVMHLPEYADRMKGAIEALRGRGLPNLWVPDPRDCHPVPAFPLLGSGKLDLRGVGELALKVAG